MVKARVKKAKDIISNTTKNDRLFYTIVYSIIIVLILCVAYPIVYIVSASFSDRFAVMSGKVVLWPVQFTLEGYQAVFKDPNIWIGYRNTIFYTTLATMLNIIITMLAAYPFSREHWPFKRIFMFFYTFTMLFSGGMIPTYILVQRLGLTNTIWAMIIPGALSIYNMIIARTFIQSNIPHELYEAALLDGCNDYGHFFHIVLPLSKTIIAVLVIFYSVGHWNAYFKAFIYLSRKNLYPLSIFLREVLIMNKIDTDLIVDEELMEAKLGLEYLLKYALIVVSTAPIMCIYPFLQRHFVKGVMVGSLKG